jgi:hypothetical protein
MLENQSLAENDFIFSPPAVYLALTHLNHSPFFKGCDAESVVNLHPLSALTSWGKSNRIDVASYIPANYRGHTFT